MGWESFSSSVPEDYNPACDYQSVSYTNYSRIPLITKPLASFIGWATGQDTAEVSIRSYVLNAYETYLLATLAAYLSLCAVTAIFIFGGRAGTRQGRLATQGGPGE